MNASDVQKRTLETGTPPDSVSRRDSGRFLAVVPAYNERDSIAAVVQSIRRAAPYFDAVVVDDGSTDDTARRAAQAGATVVRLPFNLGIGGAVQSGFIYAFEHDYDFVVQVDGDGQHDAHELATLVDAMFSHPDVDVVCGSRFLPSDHRYRAPLSRRTGIRIFAFILSRLVGGAVSDPTSGFRIFNRRAIALFARDYPHDYPEVEVVLMAHTHRLRMIEVPVRMHPRSAGESSINKRASAYYMVKVSLALCAALLRRRPVIEPGDPSSVSTGH